MNADRFFWMNVTTGSTVQLETDRLELGERAAGEWCIEALLTSLVRRGLVERVA